METIDRVIQEWRFELLWSHNGVKTGYNVAKTVLRHVCGKHRKPVVFRELLRVVARRGRFKDAGEIDDCLTSLIDSGVIF